MLGNPPYVKLQNLMKVDPDVAAYLSAMRGDDTYASAQTGNFDLYLPFIEKGLRLARAGRAYGVHRAESLAGEPVRRGAARPCARVVISIAGSISRPIRYFEDVITYTALQFLHARAARRRADRGGTKRRDGRY